MSQRAAIPLAALLFCVFGSPAVACGWGHVVGKDGLIGDTVVELSATGDSARSYQLLGKVADYGPCPVDELQAQSLPLTLSETPNNEGCEEMPKPLTGCAVLVDRGTCAFLNKTLVAERANASVLLVGDNFDDLTESLAALAAVGCTRDRLGECRNATLPTVFLSFADQVLLKALLAKSPPTGDWQVRIFARPQPLLDMASLVIWAIAVCTVYCGARLNVADMRNQDLEGGDGAREDDDKPVEQELTMQHALGFVIMSSVVLLLLFYLIRYIVTALIVVYAIGGGLSLGALVAPVLARSCRVGTLAPLSLVVRVPCLGDVTRAELVACSGALALAGAWFAARRSAAWAWLVQDMLSVALCLGMLQTVRFRNVKVCTVLLSLAMLYDVFWVYLSPLLFSENVMIDVATGKGHAYANSTTPGTPPEMLPMLLVVPRFSSWMGGVSLLGLGDIVLPGLLVSFALRCDTQRAAQGRAAVIGYFPAMLLGYAAGLVLAVAASVVFQAGQPALVFLVPCTLAPFHAIAWWRRELRELWSGEERAGGKWAGQEDSGGWDGGGAGGAGGAGEGAGRAAAPDVEEARAGSGGSRDGEPGAAGGEARWDGAGVTRRPSRGGAAGGRGRALRRGGQENQSPHRPLLDGEVDDEGGVTDAEGHGVSD